MNNNLVLIFISELVILYLITLIIYFLSLINRKVKIEDRLGSFTTYKEKKSIKIFDQIFIFGNNFIKSITKFLYKIKIFDSYSSKYQKYIKKDNEENIDKMDFVSKKLVISLLFIIIVLFYDLFAYKTLTILQIIIVGLIGFYVLDIFMISDNKFISRQKENDLLRAITIMNNSFKSGHSIMQAIKLVSEELDSTLGLEFKKMYVDLTYGLNLDVVFKRFESRVNMDEVKYITTSLTILNETGGDIVKVFESVEKNYFNNKKLNDELNNLTASSKLLYYILLFIPITFILVIYILDNNYFSPLFNNIMGYIIMMICAILYVTYIVIVKRIMKIGDKL